MQELEASSTGQGMGQGIDDCRDAGAGLAGVGQGHAVSATCGASRVAQLFGGVLTAQLTTDRHADTVVSVSIWCDRRRYVLQYLACGLGDMQPGRLQDGSVC